jgi:hypothetical protein
MADATFSTPSALKLSGRLEKIARIKTGNLGDEFKGNILEFLINNL